MTDWLGKITVRVGREDVTFTLDLQGVWHCDRPDLGNAEAALGRLNNVHSPGTSRAAYQGFAGVKETREAAAAFRTFDWCKNVRDKVAPHGDYE